MDAFQTDQAARQDERTDNCQMHGDYTARRLYRDYWTKCPTCAEEQHERERAEAQRAKAEAKKAEAEERMSRRLVHSGLVGRFCNATFDGFTPASDEQRKALTTCREFAESLTHGALGGLWLIGPPGTGKTHLGSAMVNHLIRQRDMWAAIHSTREIVRMLRKTWGEKRVSSSVWDSLTTEDEVIDFLGSSLSLLVLDEVGVGFGSDAERVQLFDVLDLRYRNALPTVLLSNLTAPELKPALGDRLYDRLREGAKLVACNWPSHRGGITTKGVAP